MYSLELVSTYLILMLGYHGDRSNQAKLEISLANQIIAIIAMCHDLYICHDIKISSNCKLFHLDSFH